uniref:Uncharacterized protein n=1 Tax=Anguilla anguilla TaxID=7936 RepID=A0A0E9WQJ3_ANGAN
MPSKKCKVATKCNFLQLRDNKPWSEFHIAATHLQSKGFGLEFSFKLLVVRNCVFSFYSFYKKYFITFDKFCNGFS